MGLKVAQKTRKMTPTLRFKGFEGVWDNLKLGNLVEFFKGRGISKKDVVSDGSNECIRYGELYTTYDEVIQEIVSRTHTTEEIALSSVKFDVLIPSSGETAFDIATASCVLKDGVLLGGDLNVLRCNKHVYGPFLAYNLSNAEKLDIAALSQGYTVAHLYSSHLKNLRINIPSNEEQQKIASFLTTVDNYLQNLKSQKKALEKYKKGMMQKIFSQEIRFKDDAGNDFPDWRNKKLGEVFVLVTTKNAENNTNVLTISAQQGLISQRDYFNKLVSAKDVTGYYLLKKGDFAYNKSYSKGYPIGAIKRLDKYEKGVVSTLYICFRLINDGNFGGFFAHYFDAGCATKQIQRITQEGARNHGLLNMSVLDFFEDVSLHFPVFDEQQKIASFLSSLDNLIQLKETQIETAQTWRKGLMQEMFV